VTVSVIFSIVKLKKTGVVDVFFSSD